MLCRSSNGSTSTSDGTIVKKILLLIGLVLLTSARATPLDADQLSPHELKPERQQAAAAYLATEVLTRFHYKPKPLNKAQSEKIFDQYLKSLDPEKSFFVQSDIDQMSGYRSGLGEAIIEENLAAPFAIFNLYARRVSERFTYARGLLKQGFDFREKESYQYERGKAVWAASEGEMRELWRKRVKNDWLRLKLAGKDDKGIVEILDSRYEHSLKRMGQAKSEDAFQAFMNAYTMAIEPHTNYMGLRAAEDFDISMKLSLVGIGAALTEKYGYTIIRELVPGGPAALSGQVESGDRILGIAQGENGAMTDVLGWRLDDIVALIRGSPDSVVLLDVLPAGVGPDGTHKIVSLVRKKIVLDDQAAKESILSVADGKLTRHIGVITLPAFYQDFEARQKDDPHFKSATRDISRLLEALKTERVDGVLIDLRNNGGGSLSEAIDLTGLFVGKGPVVQQRNARGEITVESDTNTDVVWTGPLGVLINRGSASASEIFAAAIQDYGRGLVIGEPSFGKGTVQTVIDLDHVAKSDKPQFGELKMTVAQFFRITGETTQLRGVKPDILLPTASDTEEFGEASYENALPWMQIKAANYSPKGDLKHLLPGLLKSHDARVKKDKDFQFLQEELADLKLQRRKKEVSLNESERRQERGAEAAQLVSRKGVKDAGPSTSENVVGKGISPGTESVLQDDGLQADERNLANELASEKNRKNAKDILLNEAAHIICDEAGMLKISNSARFAAHAKLVSISPLIPNPRQAPDAVRPSL